MLLINGFSLLIVLVFLSSCESIDNEDLTPIEGQEKLSEAYVVGAATKLEIWGDLNYFTGFNKLNVVLYDSLYPGKLVENAELQFQPLMTMNIGETTMKHASPFDNPVTTSTPGIYGGSVLFIMPSSSSGAWKLNVMVVNKENGKSGTASMDISVEDPQNALVKSFVSQSADSSKLFVTLVQPKVWKVGSNDLEFTIHKKATMMSFPADSTYTIEFVPEMPSMGHSSPNNVNPTSVGKGHYMGKVNFTMTGEWKLNVTVKKEGVTISNGLYYTVNF